MKDWFKGLASVDEIYTVEIELTDDIPDEMPKYSMDYREMLRRTGNVEFDSFEKDYNGSLKELRLRDLYTNIGMYGFVSWRWVNPFVEWLNGRKVLEVMAGRGWLSHALRLKGVEVIATDNFSWGNTRGWKEPLTEVIECDAVESVKLFGDKIDVLVMSWPYMDNTAFQVIKELHRVNPKALVVYIGENGGCTADDEFHDHFELLDDPEFEKADKMYQRWYGLHDYLMLGRYTETTKQEDE